MTLTRYSSWHRPSEDRYCRHLFVADHRFDEENPLRCHYYANSTGSELIFAVSASSMTPGFRTNRYPRPRTLPKMGRLVFTCQNRRIGKHPECCLFIQLQVRTDSGIQKPHLYARALQSLITVQGNGSSAPARCAGGSLGCELASGKSTTTSGSDLDIIIYADERLWGTITQPALIAATNNLEVPVDIRMETPMCRFITLAEYAG